MQLENNLISQIVDLAKKYDSVEKVILFGSRARGDADERSDIDLAIEGKNISDEDWLKLYYEFQEDIDTLLSIDIVWLNEISDELHNNIKREGCVIYDNTKIKTKYGES